MKNSTNLCSINQGDFKMFILDLVLILYIRVDWRNKNQKHKYIL